jgi:hypothetical protein
VAWRILRGVVVEWEPIEKHRSAGPEHALILVESWTSGGACVPLLWATRGYPNNTKLRGVSLLSSEATERALSIQGENSEAGVYSIDFCESLVPQAIKSQTKAWNLGGNNPARLYRAPSFGASALSHGSIEQVSPTWTSSSFLPHVQVRSVNISIQY